MAKGSQLSQLKSALSHAGITQPQGKKRKRSVIENGDKDRKAAKLQEIQQKMNPFDVQVTKLKHDVGGRKIKGATGRPALSKQAGLEQRTKTLLKEYKDRDRAGGIVDRRFGENDPTIAPEERMLERFTRERQRASKGALFNLEDEDELTHYGQSLSKLDDFDNVGLGLDEDEEDDEGQIDSHTVQNTHFGGFSDDEEGESSRTKSKAEVMAEVIAKSKEHKFLRKMQQAEDDGLRQLLDQDMESIRALLYAVDSSHNNNNVADVETSSAKLDTLDKADLEYDKAVRELAFERRAKPKDRTKTEEEVALEEKHALETAERKRLKRMRGEEDNDSEEEFGRRRRRRQIGGDDLEDDFYDEGSGFAGFGPGLKEDAEGVESKDADSKNSPVQEDSDHASDRTGDDDEDSETESHSEGLGSNEEEEVQDLLVPPPALAKTIAKTLESETKKELPFTFACPDSYEEFLDIIDGIEDKDVPTVVQRIRTLHHPSLAEGNKLKLQRLSGVLLDYVLHITSPPTPRFTLLSGLLPHLFALAKTYPSESAQYFVDKLSLMQRNLKLGLSRGATDPQSKTWPGLPELSLLRVIGLLWSASDLNHRVVSPTRLLMGAYLGLCRIRSLDDIGSGLFLCTLWLQFEELSNRFVPEVVNFLVNAVLHLAPHKFKEASSVPGFFPSPDFQCHPELTIDPKKTQHSSVGTPSFSALYARSIGEQAKVDLLACSLTLLDRFAEMYKGFDGFPELYRPIQEILEKVRIDDLCESLQKRVSTVEATIGRLLKFAGQSRHSLTLQMHKPIPIPSYVPKFDSHSSSYLRNRDPDYERNEAAKLRRQYKQEKRGAIRELRKDAKFLAGVQEKEQQEKDRRYNERIKKAIASIEPERAEEKAMLREKARDKRRAGGK